MDNLVPTKITKMFATGHISLSQNIPKCFCDRGSAPKPIREAHGAPQTSYVHLGPLLGGEGKEKIKKRKEIRKVGKERGWPKKMNRVCPPRNMRLCPGVVGWLRPWLWLLMFHILRKHVLALPEFFYTYGCNWACKPSSKWSCSWTYGTHVYTGSVGLNTQKLVFK